MSYIGETIGQQKKNVTSNEKIKLLLNGFMFVLCQDVIGTGMSTTWLE